MPLSNLSHADAEARSSRFVRAQGKLTAGSPASVAAARRDIAEGLEWLWDVIAEPILTNLGYLTTPDGKSDWPRIWWCPVGVLALLPLHAAGHHLQREYPPQAAVDRVISSYTTTVRALAYSRAQPHRPDQTAVIVAAANIPGAQMLPGATAELADLTRLIPGSRVLSRPIRREVLQALPEHGIAHFACHAMVDYADPAHSELVVYDRDVAPLTAADVSTLHLTRASLAYLSACSTSVTTADLADEALHLAGAFQLAGFRQVIATLWPVGDLFAAQMASEFYEQITAGGSKPPDVNGSAAAAHHSARRLRDKYPGNILAWASHTHTGI